MKTTRKKRPRPARHDAGGDPHVLNLLDNIDRGKTALQLDADEIVFSQGDAAGAMFFVQSGRVKLSVVSHAGKEAVLAMLGPLGFLGEGCLVGQNVRVSTATTVEPSMLFRVERQAMLSALHEQPQLSERFTALLLSRNIDLEEDLCDQLFNHSEKRLARVLLKLTRFGQPDMLPEATMPRISHETLAEMVGTTRARVTYFMNKFRAMGLIDYNGVITIRSELLTDVVLHD